MPRVRMLSFLSLTSKEHISSFYRRNRENPLATNFRLRNISNRNRWCSSITTSYIIMFSTNMCAMCAMCACLFTSIHARRSYSNVGCWKIGKQVRIFSIFFSSRCCFIVVLFCYRYKCTIFRCGSRYFRMWYFKTNTHKYILVGVISLFSMPHIKRTAHTYRKNVWIAFWKILWICAIVKEHYIYDLSNFTYKKWI